MEQGTKKSKLKIIIPIVIAIVVIAVVGIIITTSSNNKKNNSKESLEEIYAKRLTLTNEMITDIENTANPYNNGKLCSSWQSYIISGAMARLKDEQSGMATTTETKGVNEYTHCTISSMKQDNRCNYKIYGTLYGKDKFNRTTSQPYVLIVYCMPDETTEKGYKIVKDGFELS